MAKITKKYEKKALEMLRRANGGRRSRIVSADDLLDLIQDLEALYAANRRKKYFDGVEGWLLGEYWHKPRAYSYRAVMTEIYISLRVGRPPVIQIQAAPWGYVADYKRVGPCVIWE